jgi:hypothetical protein
VYASPPAAGWLRSGLFPPRQGEPEQRLLHGFANGGLGKRDGNDVLRWARPDGSVSWRYLPPPAKSLMRMLRPGGNPSAANLSNILSALQETEGASLELALRQ